MQEVAEELERGLWWLEMGRGGGSMFRRVFNPHPGMGYWCQRNLRQCKQAKGCKI